MFGFGAFGEVPFGDLPTTTVVIVVNGVLEADAATISGVADLDIIVNGVLVAQAAGIDGSVLADVNDVTGTLAAQSAVIAAIVRRNMQGVFNLDGAANMEFVGTTIFIDMIESGDPDVRLSYSAEIHLRSL